MSTTNHTPESDILKNREALMDIEILINQFRGDRLYTSDDSFETQLVGKAVAEAAHEKLMDVMSWLEEMNIQATQTAEQQEPGQ